MPKKPTGNIGPVLFKSGPDGSTVTWEKIGFSENKETIEQHIFDLWTAEMKKAGHSILDATQNPQNDFDFTLELSGRTVYMDLVELFYRDKAGKPYENDDIKICVVDFAKQIRNAVLKKSQHYGKAGDTPINLLLYVTHWRFVPLEPVIRLAQHFLNQTPPIMENVFLVLPFTPDFGTVRVLFPSHNPLDGKALAEFDTTYFVHNPSEWKTR